MRTRMDSIENCANDSSGMGGNVGFYLVLPLELVYDHDDVVCFTKFTHLQLLQLTVRGVCTTDVNEIRGATKLLLVESEV